MSEQLSKESLGIQITPEEYLKTIGIDLNTTTLLSVIDGHLRQVDLIYIMSEYSKEYNKPMNQQIIKSKALVVI